MAQGFVYILLNPSFPDQVKIGQTKKMTEIRAKQLQTSGVPTPFIIVYDELVSDCEIVEYVLHKRFEAYRTSSDREFFRIPVREAIRALQETATNYKVSDTPSLSREDILPRIEQKYGEYLKPYIISIEIVQSVDICFLEVARLIYPGRADEIIERMDLSVFVSDEQAMFSTENPISVNADRFVNELSAYDLTMTGAPLFTEEACDSIAYEWEERGKIS